MVAPHLVLTGCIKIMKTTLSSGHPVAIWWLLWLSRGALGNNRTIKSMPTGGILHTCMLAVATSEISHHKSEVAL